MRDGDSEDQQLAFERVRLNMPNRHSSRLVNSQMDIQNLWFQGEVYARVLTMGAIGLKTVLIARRLRSL